MLIVLFCVKILRNGEKIDRNKCISGDFRSSKFHNFLRWMPLTPLDKLALSALAPKYAVQSLNVECTVLLIPRYLYMELGTIASCGKKNLSCS